jgi:hypothetical protein
MTKKLLILHKSDPHTRTEDERKKIEAKEAKVDELRR